MESYFYNLHQEDSKWVVTERDGTEFEFDTEEQARKYIAENYCYSPPMW